MEAARDGLNEARTTDDGNDHVVNIVADGSRSTSTSPSLCRHSTTPPPSYDYCVDSKPESSGCLPDDELLSTCAADNVDQTAHLSRDVPTITSTSMSVSLVEQLVNLPRTVVTTVPASTTTSGADRQIGGVSKSFLQKLESFVSSVGQVAPASFPSLPFSGWIRQPVHSGLSGGSMTHSTMPIVRRPVPVSACQYPMNTFLSSPTSTDSSCQPLDLSAARQTEHSAIVNCTKSPHRRNAGTIEPRFDHEVGTIGGRFVDTSTLPLTSASSLACLERDFGEHSTILTRLGSGDRQRQGIATKTGGHGRRGRTGSISSQSPAGARVCYPDAVNEFQPQCSFLRNTRQRAPVMIGRTGIVGGKLDPRHQTAALRCLQCDRTFLSLPELTLHMIQSAHYANLICAAYSAVNEDDDSCVKHQILSDVGVGRSRHNYEELTQSKGIDMTAVHRRNHLCGSTALERDIWHPSYIDAAVSPARSLDDESMSSTGQTDADSLRSPTSTGSPTSPSYGRADEHAVGSGTKGDDLALMSHLLRLHPLLSGPMSTSGHADWTAAELEHRRRLVVRERLSRSSVQNPVSLHGQAIGDSLPIDLRRQRSDGKRQMENEAGQMPTVSRVPAVTSRYSSTKYLDKLLSNVRECRKSLNAAVKRPVPSTGYDDSHRAVKKYRASITSSVDCATTNLDKPRISSDRCAITSSVSNLVEVCPRKRYDELHCSNTDSISPEVLARELSSTRRHEMMADCSARQLASRTTQHNVVDASSSLRAVNRCDAVTDGHERRFMLDKDQQAKYAARFGKYYRLAQELSNRSD